MIQLVNLSKKYGTNEVLKAITLKFEAGIVYGIVGQNGAGKTTLFQCMAGLESYSGTIETVSKTALKNTLGYLQTDPFFFDYCTGREYIQLLGNARGIAEIDFAACNIFQLPLNEYAINYSTGMKKKLALTAILVQQNQAFILDEPFNGVDLEGNILLVGTIQKLKAMGKTVLISSHIFSTIKETCDVVIHLEQGTISGIYSKNEFAQLEQQMQAAILGKDTQIFDFLH